MRTLSASLPILGAVLLAAVAGLAGSATPAATGTRWRLVHFRDPGGSRDVLLVGTPDWYGPQRNPALPLVISPHARGGSTFKNMRRWGDLPGRDGVIVLDPGLKGRVLGEDRAWGYPPVIAALASLPRTARRLLPWLRWDPDRVYASGFSMGAQEALLLLARQPDLLAGVSVADPVTDFLRRWYEFPLQPSTRPEQAKATRELGGTPRTVPWLYRRRSPAAFAPTIAFSGVPLQLWWNPRDEVVVHQATTQTGSFYRLLRRLNPQAPVAAVVEHAPHGWPFRADHSLPEMLSFLLAHRRWGPPATGFSYASFARSASVWGWRFRSGDVRHGLWRVDAVRTAGFRSSSPAWLTVSPPQQLTAAVVDGRRVTVRVNRLRLSPGHHAVRLG
jgi:poly(3-hydroxybutyrate) depolymerase